ncbi:unnamed protein product [Anisakis simplex]|uniref:DNA2/NAM7 helicase-like C-terminal domain-containing protein n=1 Tax=Anisakis simplex TaxID=6269 RepID=A0A3P6P5J6_ANISI|nr:unnamed protein product [Anisakis simplex]
MTHQLDTTNTLPISPQVEDLTTHPESAHLAQQQHETLPVEALPSSISTSVPIQNLPVDESSIKFFADPQRITVALSRASHGLFIIADFPMLLKYATWQAYLRHATQETPIVSSRYINALFERTHRDHRNMLVDERGHSFLPPDTMGINRKWHRY